MTIQFLVMNDLSVINIEIVMENMFYFKLCCIMSLTLGTLYLPDWKNQYVMTFEEDITVDMSCVHDINYSK